MLAHSLAVDYNIFVICVPVAQLDRALASGAKGRGFESRQARHFFLQLESLSKTGVVLLIVGCGLLCVKTTFWHLYAIIISTQRFSLVRNILFCVLRYAKFLIMKQPLNKFVIHQENKSNR